MTITRWHRWGVEGTTEGRLHATSSRHIYVAHFNPRGCFSFMADTSDLKRLKSRALVHPVVILETKERTLLPGEGGNLVNAGLCRRLLLVWRIHWEWWKCMCVTSSHCACGQDIKPPVIFVSLNPPLALHPSHLSDLHSPALISDICLILTT